MCKNLRKSLWESCEKRWEKVDDFMEYFKLVWKVFGFHTRMHGFSKSIYTENLFGFPLFHAKFYTVSTRLITTTIKYI